MVGGNQLPRPHRVGPAPDLGDPEVGGQQQLGGEVPQGDHHPGVDELELGLEIGPAGGDLVGLGVAVVGRAALDHVGDVDPAAVDADLLQHQPVEELARPAHERLPLQVLVTTGSLADEHQVGGRVADAEHHLGPMGRERAAQAAGRLPGQVGQIGPRCHRRMVLPLPRPPDQAGGRLPFPTVTRGTLGPMSHSTS